MTSVLQAINSSMPGDSYSQAAGEIVDLEYEIAAVSDRHFIIHRYFLKPISHFGYVTYIECHLYKLHNSIFWHS